MPPVEAWKKVFVEGEAFASTVHGNLSCISCHGGTADAATMEAAHEGVVRDPDAQTACASCHSEVTTQHSGSLHWTLAGYGAVLAERSSAEKWPALTEAYENHCSNCHASCGQCHVSRPTSAGGGLLQGHVFKNPPPMNLTCTGCHGSRINDEYKGRNKDAEGGRIPADVHFNPNGMTCFDCHTGMEMHGETGGEVYRYDGAPLPSCTQEGCHPSVGTAEDSNPQHTEKHLQSLTCQTCHSIQYKNCYGCHVQLSDEGKPFFKIEPSQMMFKIGLNPIRSDERPAKYVPLRHVPIARTSFRYYGEDLLPNFDARPTWTYATPHNIQRNTPQTESCANCHGNKELFLMEEDVDSDELEANRAVIVTELPK